MTAARARFGPWSSHRRWLLSLVVTLLAACWPPLDELERVRPSSSVDGSAIDGTASGSDGGSDRYAASVLADRPVAYYRLSERDGTRVTDASGKGNHAALDGQVTRTAGGVFASDGAVLLGGGGRIDAGKRFALDTTDDFTIEAWIKPTAGTGDTTFRRVAERETLGPETGISLFVRSAGDPRVGFSRLVADQTREGAYAPDGFDLSGTQFSHVVVVSARATEVRLYVNGVRVGSGAIVAAGAVNPDANFYFGGSAAGTNFIGELDELAVYGAALTDIQIGAHFDAANAAK